MESTTVHISESILPHVETIVNKFGFKNKEEFFQEAIRDKVLELQKELFLKGSDTISERLKKKRITEKEILSDFSQRKHQRSNHY